MRSNILAAVLTTTTLALSLAACGGEEPQPQPPPPPPPPPPTASAPAPVDTTPPPPPPKPALAELIPPALKGFGAAFNAHDAAKLASFATEDVTAIDYGQGETHGRAEYQSMFTKLFGMFPDIKSAPTRVFVKGNTVVLEIAWTATMSVPVMGMKATNKPVGGLRAHVVFFNDDGLIKEEHEYADQGGIVAQMSGNKAAPPVPALPTNPPEMHIAGGDPGNDKLDDWARAGDEVMSKHDVNAILALYADDGDYWINFGGPAMKGKKALGAGLQGWLKAFPDQTWASKPTDAWGLEGFAIIEHQMSGTQKGALGPIHATNKPVMNWHFLDILQPNKDGKVLHGWGYGNTFEMMAQTGALHKPGDAAAKPAPKAQAKGGSLAPTPAPAPAPAPKK